MHGDNPALLISVWSRLKRLGHVPVSTFIGRLLVCLVANLIINLQSLYFSQTLMTDCPSSVD